MMIRVVYNSGTHDIVKTELLNRLLDSGMIKQFKRATGWVNVGSDPIRKNNISFTPISFDRRQRAA